MSDTNALFREVEGSADFHIPVEYRAVEGLREGHGCVILNCVSLVNADDVFCACLQEYLAYELRMARKHYHKLKSAVGF